MVRVFLSWNALKVFCVRVCACMHCLCVCMYVCTAHEMTVAKLHETAASSRGQRTEATIAKGDEKKSHKHFKWMDGQA